MKTTGLRGRCSPMNDATPAQNEAVQKLLSDARNSGSVSFFEVRYSTYIGDVGGPCAATRGAITVCMDHKIAHQVEKDGQLT